MIYDAPHLLKNIINNLKRNYFSVVGHRIEWKHIVSFYALDSSLPIRMAPRLTQKHVTLSAFSTMRVVNFFDSAQLAIFVRGVDDQFNYTEEIIALQSMKDMITGEDMFKEVETAVEKFGLPWKSLNSISTV